MYPEFNVPTIYQPPSGLIVIKYLKDLRNKTSQSKEET